MTKSNQTIKVKIEGLIKEICIEAQNNKFITPIVFRQSIKMEEIFNKQLSQSNKQLLDLIRHKGKQVGYDTYTININDLIKTEGEK